MLKLSFLAPFLARLGSRPGARLGSGTALAVLLAGLIGAPAESRAASVLLATIPPPSPGAPAVNAVLEGLNADGKSFITGVSLLAKFEVDGTTLTPETGSASDFRFTSLTSGEIRSGTVSYSGSDEILYFTLKAGRDSQLFGFFDAQGNQIALRPGEVLGFTTSKGLSNTAFFGRQQPVPEPTSVLLLLAGGALVARATRKARTSPTA